MWTTAHARENGRPWHETQQQQQRGRGGAASTLLPLYSQVGQQGRRPQGVAERAGGDASDSEDSTAASPLDAHNMEYPTSIKVLGKDNKVYTESISLASKVIVCCGLPAPPGGWYGPFGFLRLLAYVFILVFVMAAVLFVLAIVEADWFGIVANALLMAAAIVCALSAFAHEGLANEVTEMARQNDRYAEKNERLAKSIKDLGAVQQRLNRTQQSMGITADELQETLGMLHQLTATEQLSAILRAFISADSFGNSDQRLQKSELDDFFATAGPVLRQAAPEFNFEELRKEAKKSSLDFAAVRLLIDAVVAGAEATPGKSSAALSLVMFALNPDLHFEECKDSVYAVLHDQYTEEQIRTVLEHKWDTHGGPIPCSDLLDISREIMLSDRLRSTTSSRLEVPGSSIFTLNVE